MLDYIELSQTTPNDEKCAQVGGDDYMRRARIEARVYIEQLQRKLGRSPEGSFFKIVRCPHDFGTYLDIRFYYDDEDQAHLKYMIDIEVGCDKWDTEARRQLAENDYKFLSVDA